MEVGKRSRASLLFTNLFPLFCFVNCSAGHPWQWGAVWLREQRPELVGSRAGPALHLGAPGTSLLFEDATVGPAHAGPAHTSSTRKGPQPRSKRVPKKFVFLLVCETGPWLQWHNTLRLSFFPNNHSFDIFFSSLSLGICQTPILHSFSNFSFLFKLFLPWMRLLGTAYCSLSFYIYPSW